jgi:O-antigen/teichoic acid export membrane protein
MNKAKKSIKSNFFSQWILIPVALLNSVLINRYLGAELKGQYYVLQLMLTFVAPLFLLGFNGSINYNLAANKLNISDVFITGFIYNLLAASVFIILFIVLKRATILPGVISEVPMRVFQISLATIPVYFLSSYFSTILQSQMLFYIVNRIAIISSLVYLLINTLVLALFKLNLLGASLSYLLFTLVNLLLAIKYFYKYNNPAKSPFSFHVIRKIAPYGIKTWLDSLFSTSNTKLDSVILSTLMDTRSLGLYSVANGIVNYINLIPNTFLNVMFTRIASESKDSKSKSLRSMQHHFLLVYTIPILIVFFLFSSYIILFLYGKDFIEAAPVSRILAIGMCFYLLSRPLLKYYGAKGRPLINTLCQAIGVVVSIPLYFVFIPSFGMYGAAFSSLIGYIFTYMMVLVFLKREEGSLVDLYKVDLKTLKGTLFTFR